MNNENYTYYFAKISREILNLKKYIFNNIFQYTLIYILSVHSTEQNITYRSISRVNTTATITSRLKRFLSTVEVGSRSGSLKAREAEEITIHVYTKYSKYLCWTTLRTDEGEKEVKLIHDMLSSEEEDCCCCCNSASASGEVWESITVFILLKRPLNVSNIWLLALTSESSSRNSVDAFLFLSFSDSQ